MTFTLCSEQEIINKAGAFASTTVTLSGNWMQQIYDETVGELCSKTRRDWVTNYASVDSQKQQVLKAAVVSRAAFKILTYSTAGFSTNVQAETILDVLDNDWNDAVKILNDKDIASPLREYDE